eukprot:3591340-Pyramimonas_sp.AAC.1
MPRRHDRPGVHRRRHCHVQQAARRLPGHPGPRNSIYPAVTDDRFGVDLENGRFDCDWDDCHTKKSSPRPAPGKTTTQETSSHRTAPRLTYMARTAGGSASNAGSNPRKGEASRHLSPRAIAATKGHYHCVCSTTGA